MGGWGSGQSGGKPLANEALVIDIAWMVRTGRAVPCRLVHGRLEWICRGEPSGSISYDCDMRDLENARLTLRFNTSNFYTREKRSHVQQVMLNYTEPNFGGKRWWMYCPMHGARIGKLYCPAGGELFASRDAWGIAYYSQRISERDKPFEALFNLQKRLGCEPGWERPIKRPKGMWRKTYARLEQEYWRLDELCAAQMMQITSRLGGLT